MGAHFALLRVGREKLLGSFFDFVLHLEEDAALYESWDEMRVISIKPVASLCWCLYGRKKSIPGEQMLSTLSKNMCYQLSQFWKGLK